MLEVIFSCKNGLGVKYIVKMEIGVVEVYYLKIIKFFIFSLIYR